MRTGCGAGVKSAKCPRVARCSSDLLLTRTSVARTVWLRHQYARSQPSSQQAQQNLVYVRCFLYVIYKLTRSPFFYRPIYTSFRLCTIYNGENIPLHVSMLQIARQDRIYHFLQLDPRPIHLRHLFPVPILARVRRRGSVLLPLFHGRNEGANFTPTGTATLPAHDAIAATENESPSSW